MNPKLFRGLTVVSAFLLASSITASSLLEKYSSQMDQVFGTVSSEIKYEKIGDSDEDPWTYKSKYKTAQEAIDGYKEYSIREAQETFALLKNNESALPISKTAKVTLLGLRSYAAVYGNSGGSIADKNIVDNGNKIYEAFKNSGLQLNPTMLETYETYFKDKTWGGNGFGATPPEYVEVTTTDTVSELSPNELKTINPNYAKDFSEYNDAAIVVIGRPGGESKEYVTGNNQECTTGNIMGLSDKERAIIKEAKDNFDKVIVLVNSVTTMEIDELKEDDDIDAILWIGYPGAYGFSAVADVLNGTVSPSACLGDVFVANNQANPAMQSAGNIPWANASDFTADENVNSYLVEAEGIYSGYRYYETRYNDIVNGVSNANQASAGTWTNPDSTISTTAGAWNYTNEVTYPFGYGLSYTTFEEKLDSVSIPGDKKTATVKVTVTNTGKVASKKAVQLYAQTPYTDYDKENNVEKSAVQLVDFEKTTLLNPGESQTIEMNVDLQTLASYDYTKAKTWILDDGTYTFALGDNSHDALNNILASQGKSTADGMDYNGNSALTYSWNWSDFDSSTFRYSETGKEITNQLSDGDYSMDLNSFIPGTVTYLTRKNWNGTFPQKYEGLSATGRLKELLKNDFITLKTDEDTSDVKFGDTTSSLTLADLKGADFSDERYDELANKVTIQEFLDFASHAFHNIQKIESVGYSGNDADDGPGGSDTHYLNEGKYQGVAYSDAETATKTANGSYIGTRTAPSPQNLAYSFNKELAYENGEIIIGETSLILNLPIMIGPGGNIHRNGYNGRGGEYYSEDPILSGYIGSAVVQGAQSKGCLVNIKHAAFNDQEINRSGIAVFMNEQKARELELRNLNCMFTAKGKPASFYNDETKNDTYTKGALGVMTSYNRIGAVASSANYAVQYTIMREEWGFNGYNVTDFTGVALKAAPKESILAGTVAFCGFSTSVDYWKPESLNKDKAMTKAIHQNIKYILYSLANSNALNGVNASYRAYKVKKSTWWRTSYISAISITAALTGIFLVTTVIFTFVKKEEK